MKTKHITGALLATAVAALFATAPAIAAEEATKDYVKCAGANGCKGQGACASAGHDCAGKNECKGKGWIKAKSAEECKEKGGTVES